MNGKLKITNAAEVFLKDLSTGDLTFFGCTTESSISKTIDANDIRCGIDAGLAGIWYSNPDVTLTIATGGWNDYLIQLQNDEDWTSPATINIPKTMKDVALVTSTTNGTYTFNPAITPVGGDIYFQDQNGKSYPATYATATATVTGGAGLVGTFTWLEAVTTAEVLEFNVSSLPKASGLILRHMVYDFDNNEVAHLYFEFDKVIGDGNLDLSMTLNNLATTTVALRALPVDGKFFRQIYVPVA